MSQLPVPESNPFPVGSRVELQLTDGKSLSLQIIEPFLPFTKSLVYLVHPETSTNNFPPKIILKIYDPRYLDKRIPSIKSSMYFRWTLEAETAAAQYRQEIAEGKCSPVDDSDPTMDILYREGKAKPYLWEDYFYRYFMESSENEVDAYSHLISFQGTMIPKFYGSGKVLLPAHTRSIQPPAILIEYIHGTTLADYKAAKRPNIPPALFFRPLFDAISKFNALGVCHRDINSGKVLVSPSEAPARAVLIDFGQAGMREYGESEEEWMSFCELYDDMSGFEAVLRRNGVDTQEYRADLEPNIRSRSSWVDRTWTGPVYEHLEHTTNQ
jgi:serine/threonine protein kinase